MNDRWNTAALGAFGLVLAACGAGQGAGGGKPSYGPGGSRASTEAPSGAASGSNLNVGATRPIAASTMHGDLAALGLDVKELPPLSKLPPEKLRQVMKSFSRALGTDCNGCHEPNDYRKDTPNKRVASRMWDLYVRGLAMEDGSPLYCDSCHGGTARFLDRRDDKGLRAWMDGNFVSKLKRRDGKPHACESCHGDPFQPKILASWAKP